MKSAEDVANLYRERKNRLGPVFAQMMDVRDAYNGDIVVPLPELSRYEQDAVANLTQQGCDQIARRSNSVAPNMVFPALKPGIKKSEDLADDRRKVMYGWHNQTRLRKVNSRRYRWFFGYGCAPAVVRPDPKLQAPRWEPVNPIDCFPAPAPLDCYTPCDSIIRHKRTRDWIVENYPEANLPKDDGDGPDDEIDVLEYIDGEEIVVVALCEIDDGSYNHTKKQIPELLSRMKNRAEMPLVVVPGRVTLDRLLGHFDGVLGLHSTEASLMAMQIIATRRGIMPREWLVANPGQAVSVIQKPDPGSGVPGVLQGGTIQQQQIDQSFQALNVIDRLHASQREAGSIPSEWGGSSQSDNVRTGRRAAQVMGAAVDFTIAEAQDTIAEAMWEENKRAIAIDKGWFGGKTKSITVSTKGAKGKVTYKPSELWETDEHIVEFASAGSDINDLVINIGQRIGMQMMSKRTGMELDPMIDDADAEEVRLRMEQVDQMFFAGMLQQIADPAQGWSAIYLAQFAKRLSAGDPWYEVFTDLQKEIQEKQAAAQQQAQPPGPEQQPGMMAPGQGGEIPSVPEQGPSMQNMTGLLSSLGVTDQALRMR